MLSALCYRPSVRPSVTRVDQSKTAEVGIMKFSPYQFLYLLRDKFHPEIVTQAGTSNEGVVGETGNKPLGSFMRQYLENGTRYVQCYFY